MSTLDCSAITAGLVAVNCSKQGISGTFSQVTLLNFSEINKATSVVTSDVISSIIMQTGKKGYAFTSHDDSTVGKATLKTGTYSNSWTHDLSLRIFVKTQATKTFVDALKNARVTAIVGNKETGTAGELKYEAYGWDTGLKVIKCEASTEVADGVYYDLELANSDKATESSLPKSVFVTDLAATELMLAGLL